jgi:hypothetical protein
MGALKPIGTAIPSLAELRANPFVLKAPRSARGARPANAPVDLALDLSSTCVGWAAGPRDLPPRYGKFAFKGNAETGAKLVAFEEFLAGLVELYAPKRLFVEKPLSRHGPTTLRHQELLGITRFVWAVQTGGEILPSWIISAKTAKAHMQVEHSADYDVRKQNMVNRVNAVFGFGLKYHENSCYQSDDDSADAIAVLVTGQRREL